MAEPYGGGADLLTARSAWSPPALSYGQYTGRPGGRFTYREGKAEAIRELAEREGIYLAASWADRDSEPRPADAARGRAPVGG